MVLLKEAQGREGGVVEDLEAETWRSISNFPKRRGKLRKLTMEEQSVTLYVLSPALALRV